MRRYFDKARGLAMSGTAKDTYLMFFGNISTAFLGFVFTWYVARNLSVEDFGIFSAANNLIFILVPLADVGITASLINFVSSLRSKGKHQEAKTYVKAGFIARGVITLFFSLALVVFAPFISSKLLATNDPNISYWVALISIGMFLPQFFPFVLQARHEFKKSIIVSVSYSIARVLFLFLLGLTGLTIYKSLGAFAASGFVIIIVVGVLYGYSFLKTKPKKNIYTKLLKFSGWLGVNKIFSSISGRVDVQMLAIFAGAVTTGYYSIASRLAFFIIMITASFTSVISPRMSSFGDKNKEKTYILKSTLAVLPVIAGVLVWVLIANPFISLLFGDKYINSVGVFRALALAMIPFILTAPSVSAIIYAIKKPKYIGSFSVFQTIIIVLINLWLIPRFGAYGPTIAMGVAQMLFALYTWTIVIRYYWMTKS